MDIRSRISGAFLGMRQNYFLLFTTWTLPYISRSLIAIDDKNERFFPTLWRGYY